VDSLTLLSSFCKERGILELEFVDVDVLEEFRRQRKIAPVTWKVELSRFSVKRRAGVLR